MKTFTMEYQFEFDSDFELPAECTPEGNPLGWKDNLSYLLDQSLCYLFGETGDVGKNPNLAWRDEGVRACKSIKYRGSTARRDVGYDKNAR
jgi:hypothetical protein